jgi:hypothetical protein
MGTEGRNMDARRLCIAHNTTTNLVRNGLVSKMRMIRGKMIRFSICAHKYHNVLTVQTILLVSWPVFLTSPVKCSESCAAHIAYEGVSTSSVYASVVGRRPGETILRTVYCASGRLKVPCHTILRVAYSTMWPDKSISSRQIIGAFVRVTLRSMTFHGV